MRGRLAIAGFFLCGLILVAVGAFLLGNSLRNAPLEPAITERAFSVQDESPQDQQASLPQDVTPRVYNITDCIELLHSANSGDRNRAAQQIQHLAKTDPHLIAENFERLSPALMGDGDFSLLENCALQIILQRPFDVWDVSVAQATRVKALLAEGKYDGALVEAKSYYNEATLSMQAQATDFLVMALTHARNSNVADQFRSEQEVVGEPTFDRKPAEKTAKEFFEPNSIWDDSPPGEKHSASSVLSTIEVDGNVYVSALESQDGNADAWAFDHAIAKGNLLLLSDRPIQALSCFKDACKLASGDTAHMASALEGIVRSIRARDGTPRVANAFLLALRQENWPSNAGFESLLPDVDSGLLRRTALTISLIPVATPSLPQLERLRYQDENDTSQSSPSDIQIVTGFECSTPLEVKKLTPTHFSVTIETPIETSFIRNWFMFQLRGVAGQTVRVDLSGDKVPVDNWWTLNPVYTYATRLDDLANYDSAKGYEEEQRAWNGAILPATDGQEWKYIGDAWKDASGKFSFVHKFDADQAFVAMRIPCPPSYSEHFLREFVSTHRRLAKLIEVGRSQGNRPLLIVEIGSQVDNAERQKPCIVIYAGEHANEHDSLWAAQGAIEYLLSDTEGARGIRDRYTFLIIPMLDPDSTAASRLTGITNAFLGRSRTPEAIAYANWFQAWVNERKRLDLVFDLHNVQSKESPCVACAMIEGLGIRGRASLELQKLMVQELANEGFTVNPQPWMRGWSPDRLGGWLAQRYGSLTLAYELNSQAPDRHLNLFQIKEIGRIVVQSADRLFSTSDGSAILTDADARRQQRIERWKAYGTPLATGDDAIEAEELRSGNAEIRNSSELLVERYVQ
jgi:murein tripeptide amidase MpaA